VKWTTRKKTGTLKTDTEIDPRKLKEKCNWVNINYSPTDHTDKYTETPGEEDSDMEENVSSDEEDSGDMEENVSSDEEDSGNESDSSVATEIGEPHIKKPASDKRLCLPVIHHKVEPNARQTFINSDRFGGFEEFGEDRIYELPFKADTQSEALSNYAKKNHFCYDSVALSDYIVQQINMTVDDEGDFLWTAETKYDNKCGREMNTYISSNKYTIKGETEERFLEFTDYEFSDLIAWMHVTESQYVTEQIMNPAYDQDDLKPLQSHLTKFFPPAVIADALNYFKGYHDIVVITAGGRKLTPQEKANFNAIKDGTYEDPFKGTEFDRGTMTEAEKKEQGWTGTFKSGAATVAGAAAIGGIAATMGAGLLLTGAAVGIGAALGYSLYNGFGWVPNVFDFFKRHLMKMTTFYMGLCACAFVWVVSALFVTGGWVGGFWSAMKSPIVQKGFINIISQAINSKIVVSMIGSLGTFVGTVGEFIHDASHPGEMQSWTMWGVSWTPWFWGNATGLPLAGMFTCFDHLKNMLLKWTPKAILAALLMLIMVKGAGLFSSWLKQSGKAATVAAASTVVGAPVAVATGTAWIGGSIGEFTASKLETMMWVFGPILLKIYYIWSFLQSAIAAIASLKFVKGIFQGKVSPVDAIVMFKYVPQMFCKWVVGHEGTMINRHCNSLAKIIENAATMALLISFICDIYMDIAYFKSGVGGGGKCGKLIGGTQRSVKEAQAEAEEGGKGSYIKTFMGVKEATAEQKQAAALKIFEKTVETDTADANGGEIIKIADKPPATKGWFGGLLGLVEPPKDRAMFQQWVEK